MTGANGLAFEQGHPQINQSKGPQGPRKLKASPEDAELVYWFIFPGLAKTGSSRRLSWGRRQCGSFPRCRPCLPPHLSPRRRLTSNPI